MMIDCETIKKTETSIEKHWDSWFIPGLSDFIRIPNLSPLFDVDYKTNGLLEKCMEVVDEWI